MNVGELCNREVVIIEKNDSILPAAKLMRAHHVGDLVVVDRQEGIGNVPVGIITDRDIVIEIIAEEIELDSLTIGDVMSYELVTVYDDEAIFETVKRMRSQGVRRVPVVNRPHGTLEGILALDDLIDLMAEQINDLVGLIRCEQKLEREKRQPSS